MDAVLNDNQKPDVAAKTWLKANPQVLDTWLADVTTRTGEPALAVAKAQLAP
jgi:glycine betaine/proline transport system substrate-binding protein